MQQALEPFVVTGYLLESLIADSSLHTQAPFVGYDQTYSWRTLNRLH